MKNIVGILAIIILAGCVSLEEKSARCREERTVSIRNVPSGYPCFCCKVGE